MEQQAKLNQMYEAFTVCRRIGFWSWWAVVVLFVMPSVIACASLAIVSGFSFASVPRWILQDEAETARYPAPAAPNGMLTVRVCKDRAVPSADGKLPPMPPPVCQSYGFEQRSIEAMAQEQGRWLWLFYSMAVILGGVGVWGTGILRRSHRAFCQRLDIATNQ
ncbi:hypothetical protein ACV22V_31255 [Burkholderia sp. AW33-5]